MPANTVYVGRPSKWGNPFTITKREKKYPGRLVFLALAVDKYRRALEFALRHSPYMLDELRDKNLACFCPLGQPCHADVLLDLANRGDG